MAKFKAIKKGYYGDVFHNPETEQHVIFEAPENFSCSWAVRVSDDTPVDSPPPISGETKAAEEILDVEAAAAAPVVAGPDAAPPPEATTAEAAPAPDAPTAEAAESDDIPVDAAAADTADVNKATGVEVL